MKIWKLIPMNPNSDKWAGSDHKDTATVRAKDEKHARQIAALVLMAMKRQGSVCEQTPLSTWEDPQMTKCVEAENSPHSTDGKAELLEPEKYRR